MKKERSIVPPNKNYKITITSMSYLDELKNELRDMLENLDDEQQEIVIKWVTKKVYDSYKNGVKKGGKPSAKKEEEED